jgi:serpin B
LILSPLSAYQILGLTANGANGKTLDEMLLVLGNENLEELNKINTEILKIAKEFTTIEIANAIMTEFTPKQGFLSAAEKYEASVEALKNIAQVNNWCNEKTHGKIPKIMDELDPNTVMMLLNAIYFKGTWLKEFSENETTVDTFYNLNDESQAKKVDFIHIKEYFSYYEDTEMQVVEMPYTKDSMSAVIILPNQETDINEFIAKFDDEKIQKILKRFGNQIVELKMPKFELEFSSLLNDVLQKMGMKEAFDQGLADLTGMRDENDIYVGKVLQKSYLKVDEKGTEAADVTAVVINTKSLPRTNKVKVDRPFLFMLRNKKLPQDYDMIFMAKIEEL